MRTRPRGDIVMVSSVATSHHAGKGAPYNMGKAALEALAFTLAKEERRHGIHVNVVAPGLVDTDMGKRLARAMAGVTDIRTLDATSPFGHVCQPIDVARVVLWLCSDGAGYVTGQRIECDGGGTPRRPTEHFLTPGSPMTTHGVVIRDASDRWGRAWCGQGMPRRSQRSRMRRSPSTVSEAASGGRRRHRNRSRSDAEPRTVTSAVTPASVRLTLKTPSSVQSVHGSDGRSMATSRDEPPMSIPSRPPRIVVPQTSSSSSMPSAARPGSIDSGRPTAR